MTNDIYRAALHDIINAREHHRDHFADDADFAGWVVTRAMKALASRQEQPKLVPKITREELQGLATEAGHLFWEPASLAATLPDESELTVGNLPTMNQDEYPALGDWWVQVWNGETVFARAYGSTPEEAKANATAIAALAAAPSPDKEPT